MGLPRNLVFGFRATLATSVLLIAYLATSQLEHSVVAGINDKASHLLAFYTLALLTDFAFPKNPLNGVKVALLLGYGLSIELVQYFLPYRTFSLWDLLADGLGIALYAWSLPILKKVPLLAMRWA